MKLWLVERTDEIGYDEHIAFVISAKSAEEVHNHTPAKGPWWTWAEKAHVRVTLIGAATKGTKAGVVMESFNAG